MHVFSGTFIAAVATYFMTTASADCVTDKLLGNTDYEAPPPYSFQVASCNGNPSYTKASWDYSGYNDKSEMLDPSTKSLYSDFGKKCKIGSKPDFSDAADWTRDGPTPSRLKKIGSHNFGPGCTRPCYNIRYDVVSSPVYMKCEVQYPYK